LEKTAKYVLKYALTVVLAHIMIVGILVVMFESSYLSKSAGVGAALASLIIGRALWRNLERKAASK
jgi:Kef-type K+ transport system membrane component KefB